MCGIAGIFGGGSNLLASDASLVTRMAEVIAHRGPNDKGSYVDSRVALAHRRLSVIDLSSNGHQPMSNEHGDVWIVFNGEIYNFRELRAKYRLNDRHAFRSATDTEVLIHLYEELGPAMVGELNGMFAFAIWDKRSGDLHLARDRHGIKPLFYAQQAERFLFGSEIKCILQDPSVIRRPNLQGLHDFLTFGYIPGPQTAFEGIHELPPAHWMTLNSTGATQTRRYWDLKFEVDDSMTEAVAVEGARRLMEQSVERQLVADVPVGVLLSGGMDSSTLVALVSRRTSEPVHTYSVGFEDASFNELPYANMVARQYGTVAKEIVVTPDLVKDLLPSYLGYIDEPYADGSAIPTYYVCQIAKDDVVVVLSGEGGDEVFAGYETYSAFKVSSWFRHVPRWVRHGLIAPLVNRLPVSHNKLSLEFKMKRFLGGQDLPPELAHLWWRIIVTEDRKRDLYAPSVLEANAFASPGRHFSDVFRRSPARDTLNRLLHIDNSVFLPDDLMIKNDRMSMAHSLEARVPFTDHDLMEFMATVPPTLKLKGLRKKNIMRLAMRDLLPPEILNKKKVGLEMPYSRWFRNELKSLLLEYCGPDSIAETSLFRPQAVAQIIDEHMSGRADQGRALWSLLNYMMWWRMYIRG